MLYTVYYPRQSLHLRFIPADTVSKRWKVLRERYTKEHKKKKKPTGTGGDDVEKQWEFFKLMDFLSDFVRHRRSVIRTSIRKKCGLKQTELTLYIYNFSYYHSTATNIVGIAVSSENDSSPGAQSDTDTGDKPESPLETSGSENTKPLAS